MVITKVHGLERGRTTKIEDPAFPAMIAEHEKKKQKERDEKDSFKQCLIEDMKGVINSSIVAIMSNGAGGKGPSRELAPMPTLLVPPLKFRNFKKMQQKATWLAS